MQSLGRQFFRLVNLDQFFPLQRKAAVHWRIREHWSNFLVGITISGRRAPNSGDVKGQSGALSRKGKKFMDGFLNGGLVQIVHVPVFRRNGERAPGQSAANTIFGLESDMRNFRNPLAVSPCFVGSKNPNPIPFGDDVVIMESIFEDD